MTPEGDLGEVWTMGRPLVYRSLEILEQRRPDRGGGPRAGRARPEPHDLPRRRAAGRDALMRWLGEPVDRVRDVARCCC